MNIEELINIPFQAVGLQLRRKAPIMPLAPELPSHLISSCRVLSRREELLKILPKNGTVAEIGVADGDFSEQILTIAAPKKLYLVDAWGASRYRAGVERVKDRFAAQIAAQTIQIERGLSLQAMPRIPQNSLDWIYIDTTHDYETTRKELWLAEGLVNEGGFISGHDFCIGNPHRALPYGVIPAVSEFCLERNWALVYLTLAADGHFSFCLNRS